MAEIEHTLILILNRVVGHYHGSEYRKLVADRRSRKVGPLTQLLLFLHLHVIVIVIG